MKTIVRKKYLDRIIELNGTPDIKIITKLRDKATGKSERYVIHNVVFKNFDILNCESQKPIEQNVSIQAVDFEPLEEI